MLFRCDKRRLISESVSPLDQQKKSASHRFIKTQNVNLTPGYEARWFESTSRKVTQSPQADFSYLYRSELFDFETRSTQMNWKRDKIWNFDEHTHGKRAKMKFSSAKYSGVWASSTALLWREEYCTRHQIPDDCADRLRKRKRRQLEIPMDEKYFTGVAKNFFCFCFFFRRFGILC